MSNVPNWCELQYDLLVLIVKRINLIEDYLNFGAVCKSWQCVATKDNFNSDLPRIPWLMLAEEEDNMDKDNSYRKFFSLYNGMILKKRIPKANGKRCIESMGWLITVGKDDSKTSLLHPFSGVEIELPHPNTTVDYELHETGHPWTFFHKAVLSASPSHTSDYVLTVIEGDMKFVSFWRPGDLRWTRMNYRDSPYNYIHRDLVYYTEKIYAVDWRGRVLVYDITGSSPTRIVATLPTHHKGDECYILESMGSLFVVVRYGVKSRARIREDSCRISLTPIYDDDNDGETYGTTNFGVFQVDLAAGELMETKEVGDRALFLGANASISVQASQFPGVKPNHIYFTDDFWESYLSYEEGGGMDMGVYCIANGSFEPHYNGVSLSRVCPPIWVTPTLY